MLDKLQGLKEKYDTNSQHKQEIGNKHEQRSEQRIENGVLGFQTQIYLTILFSLL